MTLQGSIARSSILPMHVWTTGGPLFLWGRTPCLPPIPAVMDEAAPAVRVQSCVDVFWFTQRH